MSNTNYIGAIVKILETPKQKIITNNNLVVTFRVQISQVRQTRILKLVFWGNLARDVTNYYKINDYILIEGYLALSSKLNSDITTKPLKNIEITVLKVYPFLLGSDRLSGDSEDY
jgi:single-stranded DNA-binding protein